MALSLLLGVALAIIDTSDRICVWASTTNRIIRKHALYLQSLVNATPDDLQMFYVFDRN